MKEATSEVQIENDVFRVTKWLVGPRETIPMHVHEYEYVVIPLRPTPMVVRPKDGEEFISEMHPGKSYTRSRGSEHEIYNPSETETVEFVEVESLRK